MPIKHAISEIIVSEWKSKKRGKPLPEKADENGQLCQRFARRLARWKIKKPQLLCQSANERKRFNVLSPPRGMFRDELVLYDALHLLQLHT